jgi:uncharacterized protein YuzE
VILDYDATADAAYITLGDRRLAAGEAARQSDLIPTGSGDGVILLDFDARGRLIGLEVLAARRNLAPELLAKASG